MADRSVLVRLRANVDDFRSQMRQAEESAKGVGKGSEESSKQATTALGRMTESARNNRAEWMTAGRTLTMFGAAVVGAMGLAVKAAIDWESAWTGVMKTVEGSPEQLEAVEAGLRGLARELPTTHTEIAAVAQAAGQLGIATDDVVDFTKVMIDLGESTNLTADQAATALARMMNIMGTAPDQVSNLGSALVDLGNNSATTESDILQMALRIAGAGSTIGLTESDVLAFSAALSSVGVEAAAGGTSMSRAMIEIANAVADGGDAVRGFADVAGMSAEQFSVAFEEDPARAIAAFVAGLGRIDEAGGNVFTTLDSLGLGEIRVRDALLRMSGAGDLLADSLDRGSTAFSENTALAEEAEKRYATTAAQLEITRNNVVDAAISFGSVLLPALSSVAEIIADVARWFAQLPEPVRGAMTALAGLVGVASLAAGAFLLIFPRVIDTVTAFRTLREIAPGAANGLRRAGRVARTAAVGFASLMILDQVNNLFGEGQDDLRRYSEQLEALGGDTTEDKIRAIKDELEELDRITKEAANTDLGFVNIFWTDWSGEATQAADRADHLRERLAELEHQQEMNGIEAERAAEQGQVNAASMEQQADAAGVAVEAYEEAAAAVEDLVDRWSDALASAVDPLDAWEAANQRAAEAAAEAAGESKNAWQDFADDATASIGQFIAELERQVEAQQNWASNIAEIAARGFEGLANELMAAGPEAAGLVAELVDGTDEELSRIEEMWPLTTAEGMEATAEEMRKWIPIAGEVADEFGSDVANRIGEQIAAGETTVEEAMAELNRGIEENLPGDIEITVSALDDPFWERAGLVRGESDDLDGMQPTPTINADGTPFDEENYRVLQAMGHLDQQRPTPYTFLEVESFETSWGEAMADVLELDSETPTPAADMDVDTFEHALELAQLELDRFDEDEASPEAILEHQAFDRDVQKAEELLHSIKDKDVDVKLVDNASSGIRGILDLISSIPRNVSTTHTVTTNRVGGGPDQRQPRAAGGPVWPGQAFMVGERGRELFVPDTRGTVVSHADTERMMGSRNDVGAVSITAADSGIVTDGGRWTPDVMGGAFAAPSTVTASVAPGEIAAAVADAVAAAVPTFDGATLRLDIGGRTVLAEIVADGQRDRSRTGARG